MSVRHSLSHVLKTKFARTIAIPVILIFIGLMVSVLTVTFTSFVSELKENAYIAKLEQLQAIEGSITARIRELNSISDHIQNDMPFTFTPLDDKQYNGYTLTKTLQRLLVGNDFISYLVYHRVSQPDHLLTSVGEISTRSFWNAYVGYQDTDEQDFFAQLHTITDRQILPMRQTQNNDAYMTIVYPIPMYARNPKAYVLSYISDETMDNTVESLFLDTKGELVIYDLAGAPIYHYNNTVRDDFSELLANYTGDTDTGLKEIQIDGEKYILLNHYSDYNKWNYIAMIRSDEIQAALNSKQSSFLLFLLSVTLVAIIAVIASALISYRPINLLAQKVSGMPMGTTGTGAISNEQLLLTNAFNTLIDQAQNMNQHLFFSNLLAEQYDDDSIDAAQSAHGVQFEYGSFLPCALPLPSHTNQPDEAFAEFINSYFDRSNMQCVLLLRSNPDHLLLLINSTKEQLSQQSIEPMLTALYNDASLGYKQALSIGVGDIVESLAQVPASAQKAIRALYSCIMEGNRFIMRYEDIDLKQTASMISDTTTQLLQAVRRGNVDKTQQMLIQMHNVFRDNTISQQHKSYIVYDILTMLRDDIDIPAFSDEVNRLFGTLLNRNVKKPGLLLVQIERLCLATAESKAEKQADRSRELIETICSTISEGLCDNMLSLESISAACGISPSYLSRYFKTHMGCTPMQYVENLRMEQVKDLLCNTDMLLKDILVQTGYIDQSNFIRKFKKQEGITPMTYRKNNSKQVGEYET
ncbi:helix-turn-helix domain-containing protein [Ruminococcaceae bacterium OttesenSCG-928-L11]|nr:helix-turn-helix domain-containing protein [Ruminococcaceae bacterium OttesenSCG-928-L11]